MNFLRSIRLDIGEGDMADTGVDFSLLAKSTRMRAFKAGEVIFNEGEPGHEMFVIQSGRVEIRRGNRVLGTLSEKSIFGEMALIDDAPRSATAATDVNVVPVEEKQFLFLVSETPFFALNVMRTLVRRLRASNEAV
jgi:CRP/FNR family cyclic AMP-dependent transcriptional regulator